MSTTSADRALAGRDLRYVLTWYLVNEGPLNVARLLSLLDRDGFVVGGRASKTVSDALRWEVARRRVVRTGRATYSVGTIPRTTARRIADRARHLGCR